MRCCNSERRYNAGEGAAINLRGLGGSLYFLKWRSQVFFGLTAKCPGCVVISVPTVLTNAAPSGIDYAVSIVEYTIRVMRWPCPLESPADRI